MATDQVPEWSLRFGLRNMMANRVGGNCNPSCAEGVMSKRPTAMDLVLSGRGFSLVDGVRSRVKA